MCAAQNVISYACSYNAFLHLCDASLKNTLALSFFSPKSITLMPAPNKLKEF